MAHEIESMMYTNETPWHGLGNKLDNPPTIEEGIKAAGLDWTVSLKPIYSQIDGKLIEIPGHFSTMRNTDNRVLGIVKSRYTPVQNMEAFKFFQPLLDQGFMKLETAASLKNGKVIFVLAKSTLEPEFIQGNDKIEQYLLFTTSHDGSGAVRVLYTPTRVVCANTLAAALTCRNGFSVRHTESAETRLQVAQTIIAEAALSFHKSADVYRQLAIKPMTKDVLKSYIAKTMAFGELKTRSQNILEKIEWFYYNGRGVETTPESAWRAYNAITEYLTHERCMNTESRALQLANGVSDDINRRALELAIAI